MDPRFEIRRGQEAKIKLCQETRCSSRVTPICQGTFSVASKVSSTISNFKRERGISLETLQGERASSGNDWGTWSYFSSGGRILKIQLEHRYPLVLPQGSPISIRVARGSLRLHSSHCRPNRPHLGLCPETPCSSPVATGISGLHSRFTRGVRPRLEWKQRTPLPFELRQVSLGAH